MSHKKRLEPLIPLDDLKQIVSGLLRVPKDKIEKVEPPKPQSRRSKKG